MYLRYDSYNISILHRKWRTNSLFFLSSKIYGSLKDDNLRLISMNCLILIKKKDNKQRFVQNYYRIAPLTKTSQFFKLLTRFPNFPLNEFLFFPLLKTWKFLWAYIVLLQPLVWTKTRGKEKYKTTSYTKMVPLDGQLNRKISTLTDAPFDCNPRKITITLRFILGTKQNRDCKILELSTDFSQSLSNQISNKQNYFHALA